MLLISSGALPSTYAELVAMLKDIPAFVQSFFAMMIFWLSHRAWSRNYGLEEKVTIPLTLHLMVSLLVYIYPLKLMYSTLLSFVTGGYFASGNHIGSRQVGVNWIGIYGVGFAVLSATMLGLCWRTFSQRYTFGYDHTDVLESKVGITIWVTLNATGLLSAGVALPMPLEHGVWAGLFYWVLGPVMPVLTSRTRKSLKLSNEKTPK